MLVPSGERLGRGNFIRVRKAPSKARNVARVGKGYSSKSTLWKLQTFLKNPIRLSYTPPPLQRSIIKAECDWDTGIRH